jgi:hypothetical protein
MSIDITKAKKSFYERLKGFTTGFTMECVNNGLP